MRWIITLTLSLTFLASLAHAGRADLPEYRRRARSLNAQKSRDHFVMALWCEKKGLKSRAWKHHAIVLEIDAKHRASQRALTRLRPDAKALAREALGEPNLRMRLDAVRALRRTRRPARLFLPTLRNRSEKLRTRAIQALGALGDKSAVASLVHHLAVAGGNTTGAHMTAGGQSAYVQDFDVEVA